MTCDLVVKIRLGERHGGGQGSALLCFSVSHYQVKLCCKLLPKLNITFSALTTFSYFGRSDLESDQGRSRKLGQVPVDIICFVLSVKNKERGLDAVRLSPDNDFCSVH